MIASTQPPLSGNTFKMPQTRNRSAAHKAATSSDLDPKKPELTRGRAPPKTPMAQLMPVNLHGSADSDSSASKSSEQDSDVELQSGLIKSSAVAQPDSDSSDEDVGSERQESDDGASVSQSGDDDEQQEFSNDEDSEEERQEDDCTDDGQFDDGQFDNDQSQDEYEQIKEKRPKVPFDAAPFPMEKNVIQNILAQFMPKNGVVTLTTKLINGKKHARLDGSISVEDREKLKDIINLLAANTKTYSLFGGQAFRMLRFEFVKTTAVRGLLTGHRQWESSDGLPTPLISVKTITIHQSFKQPFLEWVGDIALLEQDDAGNKELPGLLQVVFTEMPADRDADVAGSRFMPSAMEKLRAVLPKLQKRGLSTWIVEEEADAANKVTVRLVHKGALRDDELAVKDHVSAPHVTRLLLYLIT